MDLDQNVESDLGSQAVQIGEFLGAEGSSDQQHTIGAHQAGIEYVTSIDGEILAQHRNRATQTRSL